MGAAVARASALLASDPAAAEQEIAKVLRAAPADPRARLIKASARRRLGDPIGALAILQPLAKAFPSAAHTQYELGMALADRGQSQAAISALQRAAQLRPDLAEAWRALGDLLFAAGDNAGADDAFARAERASVRDPGLAPAADALFAGRLDVAEALLRARLLAQPDHPEALRLLGQAYLRQQRIADAETLFARAVELEPAHLGARFALASALFEQQKAPEALPHVIRLLEADPRNLAYRNLHAACLGLVGEFDQVVAINEALLAEYPRQPRLWLNHGHALRTVGRRADAVDAYRRAIALAPGLGDAWWSLANLKIAALDPADEAVMTAQLQRGDLADDDRLHLHFALGKALEDRGADEAAFAHYVAGGGLRRRLVPYDPEVEAGLVTRSIATFTPAFFAERAGLGAEERDPIFIVGLPRSGSTLIEQILASHSAVEGVMELPDIGALATALIQQAGGAVEAYPGLLARLDPSAFRRLGEAYIVRTRIHRKLGRPFFIDKMPNNFRHIGLILTALPHAKVIDARRHPLGVGFSAFKQHFNQGQGFSYDLADIGAYYRGYVELMAHIDAVQPGRVIRVIYEDLVEDTEGQVRALFERLGLPFEDAALRFYENARAVRTVSSEQVRRPVFREGLDQWRRFEPWLGPLKQALGPALEGWRG